MQFSSTNFVEQNTLKQKIHRVDLESGSLGTSPLRVPEQQ